MPLKAAEQTAMFDKHQTLKAKKCCRTLLTSTKGLTTALLAGEIKEAGADKPMTAGRVSTIVSKRQLKMWLG